MIIRPLFTLLAVFSLASTSFAGEDKVPVEFTPVANDDTSADIWLDGWILQIAMGFHQSDIGFEHSVFLGFDDIISNIDWIVPFGGDFRYKRFGFMPDFVGLKMSGGTETGGPFYDKLDIGLKLWALNLAGYFRVIDQPDFTFDLVGGARNLYVDADLTLSGGPVGSSRGTFSANSETKIWDGIVGARVQQNLTDRFFYSVYGDVGTGDSELTWQVLGSLGYQVSDNFSALLGYRYLHYKEEAASRAVDVTASGPQITLQWTF